MKKIFSIVLVAASLLLSANMQAGNVAKIGTTEYATLQAAFTAATTGQTITLLDSVRGEGAITINKPSATITLDMNGKTWVLCYNSSCSTQGIILTAGNLKVKGFGAIKYDSEYGSACLFKTSAGTKLTIDNGNYSNSGSEPEIECGGELVIKSAWLKNISFTSTATKGTINGAHISGQISLPSTNGITLDVLAGEINSIATMNGNIKGSTVNVKGGTITWLSNGGTNNIEAGTITNIIGGDNVITGGTLDTLYYHNSTDPYAQTQYREATYVIKGGNYATINYVTDGAARTLNQDCAEGFSLKPTGDPNHPFAASPDYIKIVKTGIIYGSMEDAFAAAIDGDTIQLLNNLELNGNLNLTLTGKTITIDLNGKTWKFNNDAKAQVLGMRVYAGNIIVTGNGSMIYDAPSSSCDFFEMYAGTKLTIENGTFSTTNTGTAISSNGEVVINGGEMKYISLGDKATALTVNDGTITGQISLPSNPETLVKVVINDGTIENICTMNDKIHGTYVTVNGGHITWLQNTDSTFINDGIIDNINGGWCVIKKIQNKVIYFENDSSKSPYYRMGSFIMSGGIYSSVDYICDEDPQHTLDVAPGYGVFPNEDPDTKALYPFEIRKAVEAKEEVAEEAKDLASKITDIAPESGIKEATVGYQDTAAKFLYIYLEAAELQTTIVQSITYDVKPKVTYKDAGGNVITEVIPNEKITAPITFRLVVDPTFANKKVCVYHKGEGDADFNLLGGYPVEEENGTYFVELSASAFSFYKIEKELTPYERTIAIDRWGTICFPYQILYADGAALYEPADKTETQLTVDSVEVKDVVAGKAYIFYAEEANPVFYYDATSTAATSKTDNNGLIGNMTTSTITLDAQKWVITNNVVTPAAVGSTVGEYRAYIDLMQVNPSSAPARAGRRIFKIANTPTALQSATYNLQPATSKMMINGQLVIIRDGKMFNAQGQEL